MISRWTCLWCCRQEVGIKQINLEGISRELVIEVMGDVRISKYICQGCFQQLKNENSRARPGPMHSWAWLHQRSRAAWLWWSLSVFSPGSQGGCCSFRHHIVTLCLKARRAAWPHTFVPWNPSHFYSCPAGQDYVTCPPLHRSQTQINYLLWFLRPIIVHPLEGHCYCTRRKRMGDQLYLPLPEGAKGIDKVLRQRTGNLSTFSGKGSKMKVEKIRKAGRGSPRRQEKNFQKEEVTNSFKHYTEVK